MINNKFIEHLSKVNMNLLAIATPLEPADALLQEEAICKVARELGIDIEISGEGLERGKALAVLDQKVRLRQSGISYMGNSMIVTYLIPTGSDDVTTELIFDYDENRDMRRAYTRSVDRQGNRLSLELEPDEAMKLEAFFSVREKFDLKHDVSSGQKMSM